MLHTQFYALTRILSQISPQAKLEHFLFLVTRENDFLQGFAQLKTAVKCAMGAGCEKNWSTSILQI